MAAALALARMDIPVELVEREAFLGGQWRHIHYQADGSDPHAALADLVAQVEGEGRINVRLGAELRDCQGKPGQFQTTVGANGREETVDHGVLVIATGGRPAVTEEYLYGQDPRVLTQRELEQQVADGTLATVQRVVMIQCAGSREPQRPDMLHPGGQERPEAEGVEARPGGLYPLPRRADLWLPRGLLPGRAGCGGGIPALRTAG